ncbi:Helix-turn-helix domain-containing protein [Bradyrhizobium erythrophlei]|nr:Helix-turn-helix domain-containing protein [Bradyrhizobium erythrophlei]
MAAKRSTRTPAQYLVLWGIMADERVSAPAKCVATVLLLQFRNHKTSLCNPSFTTIAACVGRKRRSVIDALNELKGLGWMDWEGTKGGSPTNTNNFQFYLNPQPVQSSAPVQDTAPVQPNAPTGAAERTQPVQHTAHEPSIEPSKTISGAMRLKGQQGVRVHSDSAQADRWRRYWASVGQPQPAFSQKDGYYIRPLPSLEPPEIRESAA